MTPFFAVTATSILSIFYISIDKGKMGIVDIALIISIIVLVVVGIVCK